MTCMFQAAGVEAGEVLQLFWLMLVAAVAIWLLVVGTTWYAVKGRPGRHAERYGRRLIVYGGVVVPTVLLAALALWGLDLLVELRSAPADMTVRVTGEQYWWRVEYLDSDGEALLETANEMVLPNGAAAELELVTADVIHSFWVPALAGKMDMIPGQLNRLILEPRRTGTYRGQCAEFCGDSHALMAFQVRVVEAAEYRQWRRHQRSPAALPGTTQARRGRELFLGYGCGACHRVRGTPAQGRVGPDLTHLATRQRIAAHTLENDRDSLLAWLRHPAWIKPDAGMPAFNMLAGEELAALTAYLRSLE